MAPRTRNGAAGSASPRRWYAKVTALAVAIVTLASVDAYLLVMRERATPVNVVEAVDRYRTSPSGPPRGSAPAHDADEGAGRVDTPPVDHTVGPRVDTTSTTTSPSVGPDVPNTSVDPNASRTRRAEGSSPPPLRPEPGVYVYATDGYEEVSLLNTRRDYPDETTRTIRHGEGCQWSMLITFLEEHEEEHSACSTPTRIDVLASSTSVTWFGHQQNNRFECDPPQRLADREAAPGTTGGFVCREGDRTTFEGTVTYLGEEEFIVDGEARRAWRIDVSSTATGEIRGTVEVDQLIDLTTGHVLWEHRRDELDQDTQAGTVHYSQDVTSSLTDLDPST